MRSAIQMGALVATFLVSCAKLDGPVGPSPVNPRSLKWTIDSIALPGDPQTLLSSIWGSSSNDVYIAGHTSSGRIKMLHFDGSSWQPVFLHAADGGPITAAFELGDIGGLSAAQVFAVGSTIPTATHDSSLFIRFDGSRWSVIRTPSGRHLSSIWVGAADDIWMGGLNRTLFHYDGSTVRRDSVDVVIPPDADPFYNFLSIVGDRNRGLYMLLSAPPYGLGSERHYFFELNMNHWVLVDSMWSRDWNRLWMAPTGELFIAGPSVMRRSGGSWISLPGIDGQINAIYGVSSTNFFVAGSKNLNMVAYHFDGTDFFEYPDLSKMFGQFTDIWTDGREVFIVGTTISSYPQKTIVAHGEESQLVVPKAPRSIGYP